MADVKRTHASNKPKREDFAREIEYDLALVDYWYSKNEKAHPLWRTMETIEANLRCKLGLYEPEGY